MDRYWEKVCKQQQTRILVSAKVFEEVLYFASEGVREVAGPVCGSTSPGLVGVH
jgi:hypothetical protein